MKFSEYIILAKPGLMMDPLGFLSPYANLQDILFKQFTVLSNHPAYHGLLALVYQVLAEQRQVPGKPMFAQHFRELEILWGLVNASAGEGVLNVTKYKPLVDTGEPVSLSRIPKRHSLYHRLNYGTLGHYSSPSTVWGFLEKGGTQLSPIGSRLANTFGVRRATSLRKLLTKWRSGEPMDAQALLGISTDYKISANPDSSERQVWRDAINEYCDRVPHTRCLWQSPLTHDELAQFNRSAIDYSGFFPLLTERFPSLSQRLWLMQTFELTAGLVQYIFEREYLTTQHQTNFGFPDDELEEMLACALGRHAAKYIEVPSHQDSKGLFRKLSGLSSYREVADVVVSHHIAHQKSKNVTPFIENGDLLIRDRFNMSTFGPFREELSRADNETARLGTIAYHYRRNWHFGRAYTYSLYAGLHA